MTVEAPSVATAASAGDAGAVPRPDGVFVVGAPGSGTEAVYAALAAHPSLWAGGGRGEFLAPLLVALPGVHAAGSTAGRLSLFSSLQVPEAELARALGLGFSQLFAEAAGSRRWVDHSPVYARMLDRLAAAFPEASIVFVNRDGREAVAAMRNRFAGLDHTLACRIWHRYAVAWRRAGDAGLPVIEVRHDRLAAAPAEQMRRVLDFLGESRDEAVEIAAAGAIADEAEAAWSHWAAAERAAFAAEAGGALAAMGYAVDTAWLAEGPA